MIPAVMRVLEFLHPDIPVGDIGERTMTCLELGIPPDLAELGRSLGTRLSRAQYLILLTKQLADPNSFLNAETARLSELLTISEAQVGDLQTRVCAQNEQTMDTGLPFLSPPTE